jgi:hypothetical protein
MTEPRLYIVMREDLWDMNPGKGMAQAAHAQARFDAYDFAANDCLEEYCEWRGDGENCLGFGVTTVLSAPKSEWMDISLGVRHYGVVEDPTYPYRNYYKQVFTRKEQTCMWVFATTDEEIEHMKQWRLHP